MIRQCIYIINTKLLRSKARSTEKETQNTSFPSIPAPHGLPVWLNGKALLGKALLVSKRRDLGSNLLRLSFLFRQKLSGVWTLSCDFVPHN